MIKDYNESFKNMEELCENITRGGEIEFQYKNKCYTITHSKNGIHVMEAYNYDTEKIYSNAEQIGEYIVCGKKLEEIVTEIKVIFRCF